MSLFNDNHRDLQDAFDSRALADRLEQMIVLKIVNNIGCHNLGNERERICFVKVIFVICLLGRSRDINYLG